MVQQDRDPRALIETTGTLRRGGVRDPCIELRPWRGASGGGAQARRHMLVPVPGMRVGPFFLAARKSVIATSSYRPQHGVRT
jgi:hypothetical protein